MTDPRGKGRSIGARTRRFRQRLPRVAGRRGTASLVLGIIGIVGTFGTCCGAPIFMMISALAWSLGQSELRMYRALGAVGAEESQAKAGYVLGIIGIFLAIPVMAFIFLYVFLIVLAIFMTTFQSTGGILLLTEF